MTAPSEAFKRFVRAAERFCALVEERPAARDHAELTWAALRTELAELLADAVRLPETVPSEHAFLNSIALADWNSTYGAVQLRLGDLESEPVTSASVNDDLANVWRDLRTGLDAIATGSLWQDACWE